MLLVTSFLIPTLYFLFSFLTPTFIFLPVSLSLNKFSVCKLDNLDDKLLIEDDKLDNAFVLDDITLFKAEKEPFFRHFFLY